MFVSSTDVLLFLCWLCACVVILILWDWRFAVCVAGSTHTPSPTVQFREHTSGAGSRNPISPEAHSYDHKRTTSSFEGIRAWLILQSCTDPLPKKRRISSFCHVTAPSRRRTGARVLLVSSGVFTKSPVARRSVRLLDERVVVYRLADGQVAAARDLCMHRGVPLSLGHVDGNEIVKYHGLHFDAEGHCTRGSPTLDDAIWPRWAAGDRSPPSDYWAVLPGRTAMTSISTKASGDARAFTSIALLAGLFGCSLVPKNLV